MLINRGKSHGGFDLSSTCKTIDMNSTEETHLHLTHVVNGYQLMSDVRVLSKCLRPEINLTQLAKQFADAVIEVEYDIFVL